MDGLVQSLGVLGLGEAEARVYAILLVEGPRAEADLSRRTRMRRPVLSGILSGLIGKRAVVHTSSDQFMAVPLDQFIPLQQSAVRTAAAESLKLLEESRRRSFTGQVEPLRGVDAVRERALKMIANASAAIFLAAWPEDLAVLAPALREAERRGINTQVFSTGSPPAEYPEAEVHAASAYIQASQGGRSLLLSTWPEALSAVLSESPECGGIWAANRYLSLVVGLYIAHDLFAIRLWKRLPPEIQQEAVRGMTDLSSQIALAGLVEDLPKTFLPGILIPLDHASIPEPVPPANTHDRQNTRRGRPRLSGKEM